LASTITGTSVVRGTGGFGIVAGASAVNGAANTGNGGVAGGVGGSGIVILRYPDIYTISNPGGGLTFSTATVGGEKITTFTAGTGGIQFS
jgi:hypothetical protein